MSESAKAREARLDMENARTRLLDAAVDLASLAGTDDAREIRSELCSGRAMSINTATIIARLYRANDEYQDALSMYLGAECEVCGGDANTGHLPECAGLRRSS